MRELHGPSSVAASEHKTPHPAPSPRTPDFVPTITRRYRMAAVEHAPIPVTASEKFIEITRRNREEDRISNLPMGGQAAARVAEKERRKKWDTEYAARVAAMENDSANASSPTTNTTSSAETPTATSVMSSTTTSAASPTPTTPAPTTRTLEQPPQQPPPKPALIHKLKSLFKPKPKPKHSKPNLSIRQNTTI